MHLLGAGFLICFEWRLKVWNAYDDELGDFSFLAGNEKMIIASVGLT